MNATSRGTFEHLSAFLTIFIFLQGLGAASAQPADARPPAFSTAPAVGLSNVPLGISLFHFYRFTPIADSKGGFPFQTFGVGSPSINSDAVIAYHARLTGGVEGIFTSKVLGNINTLASSGSDPYNLGFSFDPSINGAGQVAFTGQQSLPDRVRTTPLRAQVGTQLIELVDSPFHLNFYQATHINDRGEVVSLVTREDGGHAVVVHGAPPLRSVIRAVAVDKPNTDMHRAIVVGSLNFQGPSMNNVGMVAFTGVKTDGHRGVFTGDSLGNFTQIVGDDILFAGFGAVVLNESGSIDKVGMVLFQAFLQTGEPPREALFLWSTDGSHSFLMKVVDVGAKGALRLGGFAMDFQGQVAYELKFDDFGNSAVFRGPGGLFGRLIGTGDVLFGRTVLSAHIGREAINFKDQLAVRLVFTDGTEMIARGDPTTNFDVIDNATFALQATTGSGSSVSVGTPVAMPPAYHTLSFDLKFLSGGGTLNVKLGDSVIKSIPAGELGVRRRITIPLDLRGGAKGKSVAAAVRLGSSSQLQFVLSGKAGLSAQISDVQIPGVFSENFRSESLSRWRIDRSGGGSASLTNASRFPIKTRMEAEKQAEKSGAYLVKVVMSSAEGLDVTTDIERPTLRLAGSPPRSTRDRTGKQVPDCEMPKSDHDTSKELVCQFEVRSLSAKNQDPTLTLEAATSFGWGITGSAMVHLP